MPLKMGPTLTRIEEREATPAGSDSAGTADDLDGSPSGTLATPALSTRGLILGGGVPAGLALGLVVSTAAIDGPMRATQVMTELVYPLSWVWLGLLAATVYCWVDGRRRRPAGLFALAWLFVTISFNGLVAARLIESLQWPAEAALATHTEPFRAVVLLGGGAGRTESGVPELNRDGQRVFQAAQVWHAGQTRAILCTGTSMIRDNDPAIVATELLRSVGVPDGSIYQIGGPNTKEEMAELRAFLDDPPPDFPSEGQLGLITSAFHMPRAMRLAAGEQLELEPLPCCYRISYSPLRPSSFIPSAGAGSTFGQAFKEYLARLVGR